ncbi:LacI family transcriptional regulator [Paenibacillus swuensis]|uniref:LacI family transcriptional regulator n=1 Tax=Paenibacillus swuensis TaxID=1178515 RepID=A0A172TJ44_9BACL|nr:LacI family DNA-binding transcriptional regulator [Paenibacillus swuensis]ANE46924.1 LacI family transcriptional regulator [Paenibacillus swuensis]
MKSKITMQRIADELKLSKNSVSQALSGKDGVSEETRRLILETAERLGYEYTKSKKLQHSETAKTGTIALIASDFAFSMQGFFGEIYLSIEREAREEGYEVIIQSVDAESAEQKILPPFLLNKSVDGVIILSHITTDYINDVIATGIPAVLIDHHHPRIQADSILTNNRYGAYDAVRYLIELGHRRIGFLGNVRFSPSYAERMDGFRMAMDERDLPVMKEWMLTEAVEESAYVTQQVQALSEQPTAWFCVNDGLGFFLNAALRQQGLHIPEDVSVVSFDNGYLSRVSAPPTTTVDVNLKLFAVKAVERLMERLREPDEPYTELLLPTRLLIRESTGPVKGE